MECDEAHLEKLRDWPLKDGVMKWLEYARQFWRWPDYFTDILPVLKNGEDVRYSPLPRFTRRGAG